MKTFSPPHPAINLSPQLYYQLVYTLTDLLPPPLDDSPEALRARSHAAIAKVAAMLPVNANEADLAAQCIAARAQAEDVIRLIRENRHDIKLVTRLNAQYTSMMRTSLAVEKRLMQVQALRRKREVIEALARQDARTRHIVERSMLRVADPDLERLMAASPRAAWEEAPQAAPAPRTNQKTAENASYNETNSHDVAFETEMSETPWIHGLDSAEEADLREHIREMLAGLGWERELPANVCASPSGASGIAAERPDLAASGQSG
jgi:hypothetical protein